MLGDQVEGAAGEGDSHAKNASQRFRLEQKPIDLLHMLIRRYAPRDGDIIIDPTFGTGATGIATLTAACDGRVGNRFFFGMDSDKHAVDVATTWLKDTKAKCTVFSLYPSSLPLSS